MRGLKHFCLNRKHHRHEVASFTDAWIETDKAPPSEKDLPVASFTDAWIETISEGVTERPETSHLLQMRGLKPEGKILQKEDRVSHLLQMRGLKPMRKHGVSGVKKVASFTDAWIETSI